MNYTIVEIIMDNMITSKMQTLDTHQKELQI